MIHYQPCAGADMTGLALIGPPCPARHRPHRYLRPGGPLGLRGEACCQHGYSHPIHAPTWETKQETKR